MPSDDTPTRASGIYWIMRPQKRGMKTSLIHEWAGLGGQLQKQKGGAWYQENIKPFTLKKQIPEPTEDDVRQYVVRKPLNKEGKKPRTKAPKIQRLVTPRVLQHKRRRIALKKQRTKKNKEEAAEYAKLLAKRMKEAKEKRQEQIAKRRRLSSLRASTSKSESSQK
uniref:Small ribosomal subunit protein eS6 n=2 Tax=Canis lupus familiaris TaxID=9615 RepID=A0A8C0SNL6_CANLF